jgi:hypothetical protein
MSGFKQNSIIVSNRGTPVTPTISGDLSIIARDGKLVVYDGTQENVLVYISEVTGSGDITKSEVNSISAGLDNRINLINSLDDNQASQIAELSGQNISQASQIAALSASAGSNLTLTQVSNASANAQVQTTNNLSPLIFQVSGENISQAGQIAELSGNIVSILSLDSRFVNITGDTMSGPLNISQISGSQTNYYKSTGTDITGGTIFTATWMAHGQHHGYFLQMAQPDFVGQEFNAIWIGANQSNKGVSIGSTGLLSNERLRISGGSTPGRPNSTDVLIGNGVIRAAGGVTTSNITAANISGNNILIGRITDATNGEAVHGGDSRLLLIPSISGDNVNQTSQISQLSGNAINQASQITALSGGSSTSYVSQTQLNVWNITGSSNNKTTLVSASTDNPLGNNSNLFFGININYNGSNAYSTQFAGRNGYFALRSLENNVFGPWNKIWTDQNDGIGSGLDADLLDGQQGSFYTTLSTDASANAVVQINNNLGVLIYQISGENISQASQITSLSGQILPIISLDNRFVNITGDRMTGTLTLSGSYITTIRGSGTDNEAFGFETLKVNTTGSSNTAIGSVALWTNRDANRNTAVGYGSLYSNIAGGNNTAVGAYSLFDNTVGAANVAMGDSALTNNTSGSSNVSLGYFSMFTLTNGSNNVAVGASSLGNKSTGSFNVAVGTSALYNNTAGSSNVGIGYHAGYNETGSNKLYIQNSITTSGGALIYGQFDTGEIWNKGNLICNYSNLSGAPVILQLNGNSDSQTTQISQLSGNSISQASQIANISASLGSFSITTPNTVAPSSFYIVLSNKNDNSPATTYSTSGLFIDLSTNTLVNSGISSPKGIAGHQNQSYGLLALKNITTGTLNVAVGSEALSAATGASYNIAVGYQALQSQGNGAANIGIGSFALQKNTQSNNIAIGHAAGMFNDGGTGNTNVGYSAGILNKGDFNVLIGHNSYSSDSSTNSNKLSIYSGATDGTSANALIFGDFTNGTLFNFGNRILHQGNIRVSPAVLELSGNSISQASQIASLSANSATSTLVFSASANALAQATTLININTALDSNQASQIASLSASVTPTSASLFQVSPGIVWTPNSTYNFTTSPGRACYGNGIFVSCGVDKMFVSDDGNEWLAYNTSISGSYTWNSVTYGNGIFVAVGYGPTPGFPPAIVYSTDGKNWAGADVSGLTQASLIGITYGNGIFVAVGYNGTAPTTSAVIARSTDGINWSNITPPATRSWASICYGKGKFVSGNIDSTTTNRIMTSEDGISWTLQTLTTSNTIRSIVYGNGRFVAIGNLTACVISPDGINWGNGGSTGLSSADWAQIAYGKGVFVAAGRSGRIATSNDRGITWITRINDGVNYSFYGIAYGNGMFVCPGYSTTNPSIKFGTPDEPVSNLMPEYQANVLLYSLTTQISAMSGNSISQASQIAALSGNSISQASQIAALSGSIAGGINLTVSSVQITSFAVSFDVSLCNTSGDSGFTATLPTAVGNTGKSYIIKKLDASTNTVKIIGTSSQTIDESTEVFIYNQYDSLKVVSNGENWWTIT